MRLRLPVTLHLAAVGEDVVLLDLANDAYHCLPAAAAALRTSPDSRICELADEGLLDALAALGARPDSSFLPRRAPPPQPRRAPETAIVRPTARDVRRFVGALSDARRGYVRRELAAILDFDPPVRSTSAAFDEAELTRLAQVFAEMMLWIPGASKCLFRSFLLRRFLWRHGHPCDWVFGVQTWPFTAHCWIQAGDLALDERPERLSAFTPILVT